MRNIFLLIAALAWPALLMAQSGVAINTTGAPAHSSAILDVSDQGRGVLVPRLTTVERNNIVGPATGLFVYNTTIQCFEFFSGTVWTSLCGGNMGGSLPDSCVTPRMLPKVNDLGNAEICSQVYDDATSVGVNNTTPNPHARLQVTSNNQGVMIPTLTTTQRLAIAGLGLTDAGLKVYDLNLNWFFYWTGTRWAPYGAYDDTLTFLDGI